MTKKELMRLSKDQLAKACRNQGVDTSGDKVALADRLVVEEEAQEPEVPEVSTQGPEVPGPEAEVEPEPPAPD